MFGWMRRMLTRLLSPEVLRKELLSESKDGSRSTTSSVHFAPAPEHKDPKSDTAVIQLEDVRKEARKAINEVKDACEDVKRATRPRRPPTELKPL
jgi:hypothetical protein